MKKIIYRTFLEHPRQQNETYIQHFKMATSFGTRLIKYGLYEYIHAFIPSIDMFRKKGTTSFKSIQELQTELKRRN